MRIRATAAMATVLLCAAISTSARAADPGKSFTIYGAGTKSCGNWLADRKEGQAMEQVELSWALGWLSASGAWLGVEHPGSYLRETDANAIAAWLDKYCRDNPLKSIADASSSLALELSKPQ